MGKLPMTGDILPPSDDHIFKTLLTHPDAKLALMDLLSALILYSRIGKISLRKVVCELPMVNL